MKDNILKAKWNKKEKDIMIYYSKKCDGALIYSFFCSKEYDIFSKIWKKSFKEELLNRGYDITTLKFEIKLIDKE